MDIIALLSGLSKRFKLSCDYELIIMINDISFLIVKIMSFFYIMLFYIFKLLYYLFILNTLNTIN